MTEKTFTATITTKTFTVEDILKRLENLYTLLDDEGLYTKANTAYLAIEAIKHYSGVEKKCKEALENAKNVLPREHPTVSTWEYVDRLFKGEE